MTDDPKHSSIPGLSAEDGALARRFAPVLRLGANDPFQPSFMGVSVFAPSAQPPAAAHDGGVERVVEYVIFWDWTIGHMAGVEHVRINLAAGDAIVSVETRIDGCFVALWGADGTLPLEAGRVALFCAPGSHALHATAAGVLAKRGEITLACGEQAGSAAVPALAEFDGLAHISPQQRRAIRRHLQMQAFAPAFAFTRCLDIADADLLSLPDLHATIARRLPELLAEVKAGQTLIKAVMIDSGDTMVDESTEVHDAAGYVTAADLIPGALEMVEALAAEGYRLVLVADGRLRSFQTVLGGHGIRTHLHAEIISEVLGHEKPAAEKFLAALSAAGLTPDEASQTVMIGNNLERDIAGANRLGVTSIWLSWSHKRARLAATRDEVPDYVARHPGEVPAILAHIEIAMARRAQAMSVGANLAGTSADQ